MLTDEEIEKIAEVHLQKRYPSDCEILHRERWSEPDGVYFAANRQTDEFFEMYIGDGGFFVTRETGEIWTFGSGQILNDGLDYWLKWYAEGWRPGLYKFVVREVMKPKLFAELIVNQQVSYLVREIENGIVWHKTVEYDKELVLRRIKSLPCSFGMMADQLRAMIPRLQMAGIAAFDYSNVASPNRYDWHPENYREDQLGPQYEDTW